MCFASLWGYEPPSAAVLIAVPSHQQLIAWADCYIALYYRKPLRMRELVLHCHVSVC